MLHRQYKLRAGQMVLIFALAFLAVLVVFADEPEAVLIRSDDGAAALRGLAPREVGRIKISQAPAGSWSAPADGVAAVYVLEPARVLLPSPLDFSIYVGHIDDSSGLALARWNPDSQGWEPVPTEFDGRTQTVRASIRRLGFWTIVRD